MGNNQPIDQKTEKLFLKKGIYKGQTKNGLPNGVGNFAHKSGDLYKGTYIYGKLYKGRALYQNKDFYIGYW